MSSPPQQGPPLHWLEAPIPAIFSVFRSEEGNVHKIRLILCIFHNDKLLLCQPEGATEFTVPTKEIEFRPGDNRNVITIVLETLRMPIEERALPSLQFLDFLQKNPLYHIPPPPGPPSSSPTTTTLTPDLYILLTTPSPTLSPPSTPNHPQRFQSYTWFSAHHQQQTTSQTASPQITLHPTLHPRHLSTAIRRFSSSARYQTAIPTYQPKNSDEAAGLGRAFTLLVARAIRAAIRIHSVEIGSPVPCTLMLTLPSQRTKVFLMRGNAKLAEAAAGAGAGGKGHRGLVDLRARDRREGGGYGAAAGLEETVYEIIGVAKGLELEFFGAITREVLVGSWGRVGIEWVQRTRLTETRLEGPVREGGSGDCGV